MRKGELMQSGNWQIFRHYRFEFRHVLVLLFILIVFQLLVSVVHKTSLENLLLKTQDWYQRDQAERMANLTTTSFELLLETAADSHNEDSRGKIIQAFNIIFSQQLLQQNVQTICFIVPNGDKYATIDDGEQMFNYFFGQMPAENVTNSSNNEAIQNFMQVHDEIVNGEQTISLRDENDTFHVLVPFVPRGELAGVLYVKNTPDFGYITREIIASFDEISIIFLSLIFLGLLAMFYISSYTVKERNEAQEQLFTEKERHLSEHIIHQKEQQFTHRIYHTHHKAEKVMGFIKEDLHELAPANIEKVKKRVTKYANFISRVIYDMKWYDPPVQSIRNMVFQTDLNEVLSFLVENLFSRISTGQKSYSFELDLDKQLPVVHVNEFVVWEIFEPLIQNSIEHAGASRIKVTIKTKFEAESSRGQVIISDDGQGIDTGLLERDERGVQKIFHEQISSKHGENNSGYGCYIAHEFAVQRCNWKLKAENDEKGGARFVITIPELKG